MVASVHVHYREDNYYRIVIVIFGLGKAGIPRLIGTVSDHEGLLAMRDSWGGPIRVPGSFGEAQRPRWTIESFCLLSVLSKLFGNPLGKKSLLFRLLRGNVHKGGHDPPNKVKYGNRTVRRTLAHQPSFVRCPDSRLSLSHADSERQPRHGPLSVVH